LRLVECNKNLIDTFDDFGQFAEWDTETSDKPFSPYAKFFDECDLSNQDTVTIKQYQPFASGEDLYGRNLIRWLGDGSSSVNQNCYPKNLIRLIYILEMRISGVGAGYNATYDSSSPEAIDALIAAHRVEGGNWSLNYIEPLLKTAIHQGFHAFVEIAN